MAAKKKPKRGLVRDGIHEVPVSPGLDVSTLVETRYMRLARLCADEARRSADCRAAAIECSQVIYGRSPLYRSRYTARICEPGEVTIECHMEACEPDALDKWAPRDLLLTPERCSVPLVALQSLVDQLIGNGAIIARGVSQ